MPVAIAGYKLLQMQAQSPIKAPKNIKPRLTKGKRNWHRQRSDFKKEERKENVTAISKFFPQYGNYMIFMKHPNST